jgi:hypothetical protein
MTHNDLLQVEATTIIDSLKEILDNSADLKDILTVAALSKGQLGLVHIAMFKAIAEGFRLGLKYERVTPDAEDL